MRVSLVIPVLNSHEIVRRQALWWRSLDLPEDVELILVDDGSDPPIEAPAFIRVIRTHDTRPWTWALARNRGAREARGEWLILVDLDYILPAEVFAACGRYDVDYMGLRREFGVLQEDGTLTQDPEVLLAWGVPAERIRSKGARIPAHTNQFAIRRDKFLELGGYREDRVGLPYPQGEDNAWKTTRKRAQEAGKLRVLDDRLRPVVYMFPNGRFCGDVDTNPFGLFHTLSRKSGRNPWE